MKYTASLAKIKGIDERILKKREEALKREIPVMDEETLNFLLTFLRGLRPKKILEIGTAVGLSAAAMLDCLKDSKVTTIEVEEERYLEAKKNLAALGFADRATCHLGDAGEILNMMDADGCFDFIFLDGPKAQYLNYLFDCKRLLKKGGVLFADDVLLFGWVSGETEMPYKRHSIVAKIKEYLETVSADPELSTSVLNVGDGVAISVKY